MFLEVKLELARNHLVHLSGMLCLKEEIRTMVDVVQTIEEYTVFTPYFLILYPEVSSLGL